MKTVILCGGIGYRLKEETEFKPKPMVTIGNKPILWHIMKIYAHYGFNEFIIALGYKGDYIKEYFLNQKYFTHDFTLATKNGKTTIHRTSAGENSVDDFYITFVDTGAETLPGERILRVKDYIPKGKARDVSKPQTSGQTEAKSNDDGLKQTASKKDRTEVANLYRGLWGSNFVDKLKDKNLTAKE